MYQKKRKRTKKAISLMAALALLASAIGTAAADVPDSQPAIAATKPQGQLPAEDDSAAPLSNGSATAQTKAYSRAAGVPTYQEVTNAMTALKETYPEGMTWTNFEPYGQNGPLGSEYRWKGGNILGNISSGVGCAAFAFILSDAAFGDLQARVPEGPVRFENVHVGDILRVNNNSHSVIVLQKGTAGVTVAEGNYNKSVHWGRAMSIAEVEAANFVVTRYPEGYQPETPEADEVAESGTDGSLHWALTKSGTLTVSGGAIANYSPNDSKMPPWNKKPITSVVIEDDVTSIGDYAFYQSPAISVSIPAGVTSIGQHAFRESQILSVTIPGTVRTIGNDAFQKCANLVSASISEGVKTIGERAFQGCTTLKYIDFPSSITSVGAGAFTSCKEMTRVRFQPGSETVAIGNNLFTQCWNLTDVTLPEKADCISAGMFQGCIMLPRLYIPAGITSIKGLGELSGAPFSGCDSLTEINFAGDEPTWDALGGKSAMTYSGSKATVNFNVPFPNPFEQDPNDPGDLPSGHVHNWLSEWSHDDTGHWHECSVQGCPVTDNREKGSYAEHTYGSWVTDVSASYSQSGSKHRDCTACSYRQTASIPATGGSSYNPSGGYGGSSGGGSYNPYGSWHSGNNSANNSANTGNSGNADKPDTDATDDSTGNTDNSTDGSDSSDSNTAGNPSNGQGESGSPDSVSKPDGSGTADSSSGANQKQQKAKFKTQLKSGLKSQLKSQLKVKLKKQLNSKAKQVSKAKLKKQLKAELKKQLKAKLKKQLKKQFGETLEDQFTDLFNKQFNAQFNELFNEQFNVQYKQLSAKKKKS